MKKLITTLFIAVFALTISAQEYNNAVGIRLGYDNGISGKHFFMPNNAVEGIMSFSPYTFKLTGLYQYQQAFLDVDHFDWYVGLGTHIGSITDRSKQKGDHAFLFGADLIAGVEYVFPTAPFALSLDWKPSISFTNNYNDYWFYGFGISLKYTFGK
jgi:hypothetical protein